MTSRERVRAAINHREPDRVPIDIGGTKVTGIHVDEYIKIGRYLGIDVEPPKCYEQFQMLARVEEPVLRWLHGDVIQLENVYETWGYKNADWKPWVNTAGNTILMPGTFQCKVKENGDIALFDSGGKHAADMAANGGYFERLPNPPLDLMKEISFMDVQKFRKTIPMYSDEELGILEKRAKFLYENTDYSIHGGALKGKLGTTGIFAGHPFTEWLCILAGEPEYAGELLEAAGDAAVENMRRYLQAVGPYIDTILISTTDFGTQTGELFSPETFRELYMPNYKKMCSFVHKNAQAKTMFHSCGSIRNIIPFFIEAGCDILNPIQANSYRMEPGELKRAYGDQLVFWGAGVDSQTVYPLGTPQEVRSQVKTRLRELMPGGGCVFSPIHNTQYDVPVENVQAFVDTVLEFGIYGKQGGIYDYDSKSESMY